MKNIVVLGSGFGGIRAALEANNRLPSSGWQVVVIDRRTFHTFSPILYEVATAYSQIEPKSGVENRDLDSALAEDVCVPLREVFRNTNIQVVHDEIIKIDVVSKKIETKDGNVIPYEFCVSALGTEAFFFGIEGAESNSYPLKSFEDGLKIREKLRMMIGDMANKKKHIIVVGGGPSGVEVIAEMAGFIRKTCRQYGIASSDVALTLMEAQSGILAGFSKSFIDTVENRLKVFNINIRTNMHIARVTPSSVVLDNGEEVGADIILWSAGVQTPAVVIGADLRQDNRHRIVVDDYLRAQGHEDFFAIGDNSLFFDKKRNMPASGTAFVAIEEGKVAAENILRTITCKPLKPYDFFAPVYVAPIGGKYAVANVFGYTLSGLFAWVFRVAIDFRYYSSIFSYPRALKLILRGVWMFSRNDG
ncbi:MAG: NAD(P)/FAD-dependent oxidoreductase [Candidatus Spechtbacteria bacterium]|nr:NAD(P)/FAD-dependent oxidoreductase [Candidatus Spechtbacteria bacterium]